MNKYKIRQGNGKIITIYGDACVFSIDDIDIFANSIYTYKDIDYSKDFEIFAFMQDDISNPYTLVYEYNVKEQDIILKRIDLATETPLTKSRAKELCSQLIELGSLYNLEEVRNEIHKLQGK